MHGNCLFQHIRMVALLQMFQAAIVLCMYQHVRAAPMSARSRSQPSGVSGSSARQPKGVLPIGRWTWQW